MKIEKIRDNIIEYNKHTESFVPILGKIISRINQLVEAYNNSYRLKQEGKCFSYCNKFLGEACECLLGKERSEPTKELLPCPFCGSENIFPMKSSEFHIYSCIECNARTGYYYGKEQALKKWNTRE